MSSATLWRYTAIPSIPGSGKRQRGELAGATAAEVRASLRRIGLQVIELKPVSSRRFNRNVNGGGILSSIQQLIEKHLRNRRRAQRAELFDSLSTMLSAGLPLLEAVQTLIDSAGKSKTKSNSSMLVHLREQLRAGQSLGQAMREHRGWFDSADVALVEAGQHGGNLPEALASMADRQEKANELGHKLIGALAYPFLVMLVGLGVVVFLSVKTLPELVKILSDAKIPTPALTARVMWAGQALAQHWMGLIATTLSIAIAMIVIPSLLRKTSWGMPAFLRSALAFIQNRAPKVISTMAVGGLALGLAELIRSGVPMVDALRVLAPTVRSARLRQQLMSAAQRVEQGEELSAALNDSQWFDAEFRRLLDIGQTTGELDSMLQRLGQRYQRQAQRLIDRLAALLEPLVILVLAVLVGGVVMAAILPLLRLQEIL